MKKNILFVGFSDDRYFEKIQKKVVLLNRDSIFVSLSVKKPQLNINHIPLKNFFFEDIKSQKIKHLNCHINFNIKKLDQEMLNLMIDRVNIEPLSTWQKNYYINLIFSYWSDYFKKNKLSSIFFVSTPHFPWDYALYLLAKKQKIKVNIICRPRIDNALFIYSDINNILKSSIDSKISQKSYFLKKFQTNKLLYSELTEYSKNKNRYKFNITFKKFKNLKGIFLSWFSPIVDENYYFGLNLFKFFIFKFKRIICKNKYKKWIKKNMITENNIKKNFVIFFLQVRPERTLMPEGGFFYNQIDAIKILSDILPKNYQILVKEHPLMFSDTFYKPDIRLLNFHKLEDYLQINNVSKVKFLDYNLNTNKLMNKAKLVVSLTSSLNWESLLINKPSFSFGETWHSLCKSSPKFTKKDKFKKEIFDLINNNSKIKKNLKSFYTLISKKVIYGCPHEKIYEKKNKIEKELLVYNLSLVLSKLIQK